MLITFPSARTPEFQAIAARFVPASAKVMLAADPATGDVLGQVDLTASWLGFVHGLHISLLSGPPGFIANGIGSVLSW